jgi:hypothetical protein
MRLPVDERGVTGLWFMVYAPAEDAINALKRALEGAGIEFIDENGGGPGVRLMKTPKKRP